jgi:putative ABC transport system substrate-binding protein
MNVQLVERPARSVEEMRAIAQTVKPQEFDAFFQISDSMIAAQAPVIIEAMREKRLATMFHETSFCDKGGLFCYGQNYREGGRLVVKFAQRILAGTSPKDLPAENYTKIEMVLNRRLAKQLGVPISQDMLLRADRMIE